MHAPGPRGPFQKRLLAGYLVFWAALAVRPVDRRTWLLENLLVFGLAGVLLAMRRRFRFSNLSALLLVVFLAFHAVGSHYTYSAVPAGAWARDALDLSRNHYDRFVHLLFGLLVAYPLREITLRAVHAHRIWSFVIPVLAVLSISSAYEILESWAARLVDPDVGVAFVGAQGDVWDGQKDMSLALGGAILAMAVTARVRRTTGHEPWVRVLAGREPASGGTPARDTMQEREGGPCSNPRSSATRSTRPPGSASSRSCARTCSAPSSSCSRGRPSPW